jgi:VCBS repeat-containing protein
MSEFQINTYITNDQERSNVAALSGGGFVVIWDSSGQDGSDDGVYAQRYDATGLKVGAEFQVNTYTTSDQQSPSIAALDDGGFITAWESSGQDGSDGGIIAQRFNKNGIKVGTEFQVNSYSSKEQSHPSVTGLSGGGFVITWDSLGQDGSDKGVFAQRFDANGIRDGIEFRVNTNTAESQSEPSVSALSGGGFIISWDYSNPIADAGGIYAQRYDENGLSIGSEFQVNTHLWDAQTETSVAALIEGGFIVTWRSASQDGDGYGVFGQLYDDSGLKQGSEFRVNTYTLSFQQSPSVAALNDGGFIVVWSSYNQDGDFDGIFAQRYDASGDALGSERQINTTSLSDQSSPSVTGLSDGGFIITWQSYGQDGSDYGIFGQRFDANGNPVAPGEESVDTGILSIDFVSDEWTKDDEVFVATGDAVIGLSNGNASMLSVTGGSYILDDTTLTVNGTVSSIEDGVNRPLFTGVLNLDIHNGEGLPDLTTSLFELAGLSVPIESLKLTNEDLVLYTQRITLPEGFADIPIPVLLDSVDIDTNGVEINSDTTVSIPNLDIKLLDQIEIQTQDWVVNYNSIKDQFEIVGKLKLKTSAGVPNFDASLVGEGLVIKNGVFEDVAFEFAVEDFDIAGWEFISTRLNLDTSNKTVSGSGLVSIPVFKTGEFSAELGLIYDPLYLDTFILTVPVPLIPIPYAPSWFINELGGGVRNLSGTSGESTAFVGDVGLLGFSSLMSFNLTGELAVDSYIKGMINDGYILDRDIARFGGELEFNWNNNFIQLKGNAFHKDNFVADVDFKTNFNFDIETTGKATFKLGQTNYSGEFQLSFTNNNNASDDFIAGWVAAPASLTEFLDIKIPLGIKYYFDGTVSPYGVAEVPIFSSWIVDEAIEDLLITIEWENAATSEVQTQVIQYADLEKTQITKIINEANYSEHGIAVIEEWGGDYSKYIYIAAPESGLWDVEVINPGGLGEITYSATTSLAESTITIDSINLDETTLTVDYTAISPESVADVHFFVDDDNVDFNGQLIGSVTENDSSDTFTWDASNFRDGRFYIYAILEDGQQIPISDYSEVTFALGDPELLAGSDGFDVITLDLSISEYDEVSSSGDYFYFDNYQVERSVERLSFTDGTIAYDISGIAGQAYRLYKAAFDRIPDHGGLGFWIGALDNGALMTDVAYGFTHSAEFISQYGAEISDEEYVDLLYANVLDRQADQGGYDFWIGHMDAGRLTREQVLIEFSESAENQANVIDLIINGIQYVEHSTESEANNSPVIGSADTSGSVTEITDLAVGENTTSLSDIGTIAFSDADISDTHTVNVLANETGYIGSVTLVVSDDSAGDGVGEVAWTYSVLDEELDHLAAGQTLIQNYDVTVDDQQGGTATETVAITITGANDAPLIEAVDVTANLSRGNQNAFIDNSLGNDDVFVTNYSSTTNGGQLLTNDGDGSLSGSYLVINPSSVRGIDAGDLNGDGFDDLVMGNDLSGASVYINNGNGTFVKTQDADFDNSQVRVSNGWDAEIADFNGDGQLDAYFATWNNLDSVWLNDGTGKVVSTEYVNGSTNRSRAVDSGDLDGDGDLDVVVARSNNWNVSSSTGGLSNLVLLNNGDGTFSIGNDFGFDQSYDIDLADVDADGDLDAFVSSYQHPEATSPETNTLWLNDGSGQFTDSGQQFSGATKSEIGDLDGDGDVDLIIASSFFHDAEVWLNDGSGSFTLKQSIGEGSGHIVLFNIDGDDDLDIFLANGSTADRVLINDGSANFTESDQGLVEDGVSVAAVASDFDGSLASTESQQTYYLDGSINFTDNDLTDRPTATGALKSLIWLAENGETEMTLTQDQTTALSSAFSLSASDTNMNDGTISWAYAIEDSLIDFLGQDETLTAIFTITVADDVAAIAEQDVNISITGTSVSEDDLFSL